MKNHYDKVLFLLALALLGIGAAFFFKEGGVPVANPSQALAQQPAGAAYGVIVAPPLPDLNTDWPKASEQEPGFIYDVFTPPKIWWDPANSVFVPLPPIPPPPFGLVFDGLKTVLYRLQLKQVVGDATRPRLSFFDADGKDSLAKNVSGFPGETKADNGFIIGEFKSERRVSPTTGLIENVQTVTVQDLRLNQTVVLELNKPVIVPGTEYLAFKTKDPYAVQSWDVKTVGQTLSVGDPAPATFTVRQVNLTPANPSAVIEKQLAPPVRDAPKSARFTTGSPTGAPAGSRP